MKEWIRHAFAVDSARCVFPTEPQRMVVDLFCREIVRRHLGTPALLFLETFRPLNYLGSQAMHFFQPIVSAVWKGEGYRHLADFLERRGSVDYLCRRIEEMETTCRKREKERKETNRQG